jgi:uncharacterized protein (DUF169 family)
MACSIHAKEANVKPLQTDLSIYQKFNFENPPVGVKFLPGRPEGISQLDKSLALCEMIKEAQQRGTPFYITKDNEDCAGAMMLGMVEPAPHPGGGELGVKYGIFEEARANERLSYSTGEIWSSNVTTVGACAWTFVYPYQSGRVNYVATGLTFGLKARRTYPEGWVIVIIPYHWIPTITKNLEKMEWVLPAYTDGTREQFLVRRDKIFGELAREFGNP